MQAGVGAQAGRQAAPRECEQPVAINDKAAKDRSHFMAFSPSLPAGLVARVRQDTKLYLAVTWMQGNMFTFHLTNQNCSLYVEKVLHFHVTSEPSELARGKRADFFIATPDNS